MPKGNILQDSFEQIVELGQTTAKQGAKQISQTFSPLKILENITQNSPSTPSLNEKQSNEKNESKSTPLNFEKLKKNYEDKDKAKTESLRNRLFQLVKQQEEKSLEEKKTKEEKKGKKEEYKKEEKKKLLAQQKQAQETEIPQGKQRRSIFSPNKVVKREQAEVRPASGKQ
jgi:hypothetical protein